MDNWYDYLKNSRRRRREKYAEENKNKKGRAFIDELDKNGCICHFQNISFSNEENTTIRELDCIFWQKEWIGNKLRYFLFVSFGRFDMDMDLDIFLNTFIFPHTDDIRIREVGSKKYISYEEYKKKMEDKK